MYSSFNPFLTPSYPPFTAPFTAPTAPLAVADTTFLTPFLMALTRPPFLPLPGLEENLVKPLDSPLSLPESLEDDELPVEPEDAGLPDAPYLPLS